MECNSHRRQRGVGRGDFQEGSEEISMKFRVGEGALSVFGSLNLSIMLTLSHLLHILSASAVYR